MRAEGRAGVLARTRYTRTGRAMFLSACSPISSKSRSSRPRGSSCTRAETQIPPGSAMPSSRAATLTPSPKMSPSSTTMSPWLMPMRNSMRRSAATSALRSAISRLHRDGAAHRVDDAGELDQHPVAGGLDDAARDARRSSGSISSRRSARSARQRALLVLARSAANTRRHRPPGSPRAGARCALPSSARPPRRHHNAVLWCYGIIGRPVPRLPRPNSRQFPDASLIGPANSLPCNRNSVKSTA